MLIPDRPFRPPRVRHGFILAEGSPSYAATVVTPPQPISNSIECTSAHIRAKGGCSADQRSHVEGTADCAAGDFGGVIHIGN